MIRRNTKKPPLAVATSVNRRKGPPPKEVRSPAGWLGVDVRELGQGRPSYSAKVEALGAVCIVLILGAVGLLILKVWLEFMARPTMPIPPQGLAMLGGLS